MANAWYNRGKLIALDSSLNLTSDTIRVLALKGTGYTFDPDHDFVTDLTPGSNEVSGGSYARQDLGTKAVNVDDTNDRAEFTAAATTFSAVPAQGGSNVTALVVFKFVTNDTDSPLIAYIDTGTGFPLTPNGSDITVTWNAEGVLQLT